MGLLYLLPIHNGDKCYFFRISVLRMQASDTLMYVDHLTYTVAALYGTETWTLRKVQVVQTYLEGFEIWC
jgi:hypothetical protein